MTPLEASVKVIGCTRVKAASLCKKFNLVLRIVTEDGTSFIGDCSVNMSRINVHIVQGKITKAYLG